MKKIFRLALVFAVCGGALMFTGCTKDYSEDIASVEKKLQDLQTGTIATQTTQIAQLQQTAAALGKTDEALQASIGELKQQLETAKQNLQAAIDSKATSTAIEALQARVSALESGVTTLTGKMATVEAAIESIKATCAKQADLDLVKATYATKAEVSDVIASVASTDAALAKIKEDLEKADEAIKASVSTLEAKLDSKVQELADKDAQLKSLVEKEEAARQAGDTKLEEKYDAQIKLVQGEISAAKDEITTIKGSIDVINTKISSLEAKDADLQKQIDAVKTTADSALEKANEALTKIGILSEDLHTNYYKKSEIDETVKGLNAQIAGLDAALATEKSVRESKEAELQGNIDAEAAARAAKDEALEKKYDKEVSDLKAEIARIDENIDNIEKDIKSINDKIAALEAADTKLGEDIAKLDGKLDLAIADALAKIGSEEAARIAADDDLQGQITAMGDAYKAADKALDEKVDALDKKVDAKVKELQDEDASLLDQIGQLNTALAAEESARKELDTKLTTAIAANAEDILKNAGDIADNAAEITAIKSDLDLKKSDIAGINDKIAALTTRVEANEKAIKDLQDELATLDATVTANKVELQGNIDKIDAAITSEISDRKAAIEAVNTEIGKQAKATEESIAKLAGEIKVTTDDLQVQINTIKDDLKTTNETVAALRKEFDAVKVRVTSISVLPTNDIEILPFSIGLGSGKTEACVFAVNFEVQPASAISSIKKEDLTFNYTISLKNVRSSYGEEAIIDSLVLDPAKNTVRVLGHGLKQVPDGVKQSHYFALTYSGNDDAGKYYVTSDFAQAYEVWPAADLNSQFNYKLSDGTTTSTVTVSETLDYKQAEAITAAQPKYPFAGVDTIVFTTTLYESFFGDKPLTLEEFTKKTGITTTVSQSYGLSCPDNAPLHVEPTTVTDQFFGNYAVNMQADMKLYIGNTYTAKYSKVVNGKEMGKCNAEYKITSVQHTLTAPVANIYWNYKTYKKGTTAPERREAIVTVADMPATAHIDNDLNKLFTITDKVICNETNITTTGVVLNLDDVYTDKKDTIKFASLGKWQVGTSPVEDEYTVNYKVVVDTVYAGCTINVDTVKVDGSITKDITFTFPGVIPQFVSVEDQIGTVKPQLIHGLTADADILYDNVLSAFITEYKQYTGDYRPKVKIDGVSVLPKNWKVTDDGDLKVTFKAGTFNYGETHTFEFKKDACVFGTSFIMNSVIVTKPAPFGIKTAAYVVDGVGTVRGQLDLSNTYVINDLFYAKQIEGENMDQALALEDALAAFTVKFENEGETDATGDIENPGFATPIALNPSTQALNPSAYMTWGDRALGTHYTGLVQNMKATLLVNGVEVANSAVEYKLVTDIPVKCMKNATVTADKEPAVDKTIKLTKGLEINALNPATLKYDIKLVDAAGDIVPTTTFNYDQPALFKVEAAKEGEDLGNQFTATVNDIETTFKKDVDYKWDSTNPSEIKLVKDNIKGVIKFSVKVTMTHYLDYDNTKPVVETVNVEVNQL